MKLLSISKPVIPALAFIAASLLAGQTVIAAEDQVCHGQAFDNVLHFKYEESGDVGCVGWNEGTASCLYRDEWEGGRGTDSVECDLAKGKLKVKWFDYPGTDAASKGAKLKATFRAVDTSTGCFKKMDWEWKNVGRRWTGKGFPHGSSICP